MLGKRHPASRRAHLLFAPLSVLVLLASAFSPTLAQASSSGIEYSDAPPSVPGKQKTLSGSGSSANSSTTGGGQAAGSDGEADSEAGVGAANDNPSSGAGKKKAGSDGTGQGSRADGQAGDLQAGLQSGRPIAVADEDGSSPLLPILIAVAALAAISIGAVLMRQRRGRDDSSLPASPRAS